MNPIAVAVRGKGPLNAINRIGTISQRYGLTPGKMDSTLAHFAEIVAEFNCGATFPITGAALARSPGVVERYREQNIEFAVHGYYHVDHARLSLDQQLVHFVRAHSLFKDREIECLGFRSPYLRWNKDTITAVRESGFLYDSSQSIAWPILDELQSDDYRRVLDFYGAASAKTYPALPRLENGLVEIPYSLPDDEALIERFQLHTERMRLAWQVILEETYRLGELFTLGLHPERVHLCEKSLKDVLQAATRLSPKVWIARLDELTRWWIARTEADIVVKSGEQGDLSLSVSGPKGLTILARRVDALSPVAPGDGAYQQAVEPEFCFRVTRRPFIGVSIFSNPDLVGFLRQQGYIVEQAADSRNHTFFLDRPHFSREDERPLLAQIEQGDFPLVRLGRWPDGARSALCITGDIDALTLWDYNLRFLGR